MWRIRIWFMDNVWDRLFPPDETLRMIMDPKDFKLHRKKLGLTHKGMAELLHVPVKSIKNYEHHGMYGPGADGPNYVLLRVLVKTITESEEIQDMLGYKGPDIHER